MYGNPLTPTRTITAEPPAASEFLGPLRMLKNLAEHRDLIGQFMLREVVGRYKGTYLGLIWSLINPFMTLVVYTLVFGVILKVSFGTGVGGGTLDFAVNFYCGLIVYNVFATSVGRAPRLVIENPNYVKKVVFPLEVLPVAILGSSLVDAAMGMAILVPVIVIFAPKISSTIYFFPLVLVPLCALSLGLAWFLASIGVFLRDIGQFVGVMLQIVFFLTPVIYPFSVVPAGLQLPLKLNPLTTIVEDTRRTLLLGQYPEWGWLLMTTAVSLVVLQFGYMWFMKSKRAFADVV